MFIEFKVFFNCKKQIIKFERGCLMGKKWSIKDKT